MIPATCDNEYQTKQSESYIQYLQPQKIMNKSLDLPCESVPCHFILQFSPNPQKNQLTLAMQHKSS